MGTKKNRSTTHSIPGNIHVGHYSFLDLSPTEHHDHRSGNLLLLLLSFEIQRYIYRNDVEREDRLAPGKCRSFSTRFCAARGRHVGNARQVGGQP